MGAEDSIKKMKRRKSAKRTREEGSGVGVSPTAQIEGNSGAGIEGKNNKDKKKNKKIYSGAETVETRIVRDVTLDTSEGKKKNQKLRDKKRKKSEIAIRNTEGFNASHVDKVAVGEPIEDKLPKPRKKKGKNVESIYRSGKRSVIISAPEQSNDSEPEEHFSNSGGISKGDIEKNSKKGKSKKSEKKKKKREIVASQLPSDSLLEKREEKAEVEVYQMSSGDEDNSKGMKKWITQYRQSRPGLKVLQERIDDLIMAHEAKEQQARAEKLAQAAEGGWTVVVHQKGRKKTTDSESGIAVGAVAQAAVLDKMGKKKKKDVGLAFYQFNKREAHRNEIMMLQDKFEQDKKRIQQMRAARKFRPY